VIVLLHCSLGGRRPSLSQIKIQHANHFPIPVLDPREADRAGGKRVLEKEKQEDASLTRNCFPQNSSRSAGITGMSHHARPQPSPSGGYGLDTVCSHQNFMLRFRLQCDGSWDVGSNRSCVDSSWRD
uniref:Uncharacterized protein n=1 Tax=Saimiri boliviensis boliviensis TaxID=39432 RepID=A0A2K6ULX6_SAIBB